MIYAIIYRVAERRVSQQLWKPYCSHGSAGVDDFRGLFAGPAASKRLPGVKLVAVGSLKNSRSAVALSVNTSSGTAIYPARSGPDEAMVWSASTGNKLGHRPGWSSTHRDLFHRTGGTLFFGDHRRTVRNQLVVTLRTSTASAFAVTKSSSFIELSPPVRA